MSGAAHISKVATPARVLRTSASSTPIRGRRTRLQALRCRLATRRNRFNGVFSRESRRSRLSSSMVEQWTFNPLVLGSSPRGGTRSPSTTGRSREPDNCRTAARPNPRVLRMQRATSISLATGRRPPGHPRRGARRRCVGRPPGHLEPGHRAGRQRPVRRIRRRGRRSIGVSARQLRSASSTPAPIPASSASGSSPPSRSIRSPAPASPPPPVSTPTTSPQ